jgi:Domain of unknown function (DUF222)
VCDDDPRTMAERRADAFGAMATGADRMGCRCGLPDCPAGGRVAGSVLIHVIAEQATLDGTGQGPAAMVGYEGLIPAELVAELARAARLRPLIHPADAPPGSGHTPSRALADFVRCRDLTCRFPGCDRPASASDIDHTVAYGDGGCTQASNLKCLCRLHHLIKTFWGWRDGAIARRDSHLDFAGGRNLRQHARECVAVPLPVCPHRFGRGARDPRAALR